MTVELEPIEVLQSRRAKLENVDAWAVIAKNGGWAARIIFVATSDKNYNTGCECFLQIIGAPMVQSDPVFYHEESDPKRVALMHAARKVKPREGETTLTENVREVLSLIRDISDHEFAWESALARHGYNCYQIL